MKKKQMSGFTLVELLAVIVILAIILVIAVPKVMDVIKDSKKATIESTAKMIAGTAEKAKLQNQILGNNKEINCEDIVKINDVDYESCSIKFDGNTAKVTLVGSGKFEGLNVCNGTKTNSSGVNTSCSGICNSNEEQKIYEYVPPYEVNDIPSCVSVLTEAFTATGGADLVPVAEPICKGETVDGTDFNIVITMAIEYGLFSEEELIESKVIKPKEIEEVKVCVPKEKMNGVTYLSNMVKDENARKIFKLEKTSAIYNGTDYDAGIRYTGKIDEVKNKVYYNCEEKDTNNVSYGSENYDYASSCEVWRIIGVFNVQDGSGNIEKRIKIVNTESTFEASWDSSASDVNNGSGINQWGESTYSNGDTYEGADLMRLLNGYYIGKSGSTCRYCNSAFQETCEQVCDTEENTLVSQKMKPLTSIAKSMTKNAVWDTYAIGYEVFNDSNVANTTYLQEKGLTAQYTGKSLCIANGGGTWCNDTVNRTTSWIGLVGLMTISDVLYSNGWLYNIGTFKWTISSFSLDWNASRLFFNESLFKNNDVVSSSSVYGVSPSIYLSSNVQIVSGNGSTEPYKLGM